MQDASTPTRIHEYFFVRHVSLKIRTYLFKNRILVSTHNSEDNIFKNPFCKKPGSDSYF